MTTPQPITWTVHLAARRPAKAVVAVLLILLALRAVATLAPPQWGAGGLWVAVGISAALLLGAVAEFLFPVTYTLDARGVAMRTVGSYRYLRWPEVRRVYLRADGIQLSPLPRRNWLDSYRGILLRTLDRDAVLRQLRACWDAAGVAPVVSEDF